MAFSDEDTPMGRYFQKVRDLHSQGMNTNQIAYEVARPRQTVVRTLDRLNLSPNIHENYVKKGDSVSAMSRPRQILEKVQRNCLKCQRPFKADGRFNRLCIRCAHIVNRG